VIQDLGNMLRFAVETVRAPRKSAQALMAVQMDRSARWLSLLLIAVISAILAYISLIASATVNGIDLSEFSGTSPFVLVLSQVIVLGLSVIAIDVLGRRAGGTGNLDSAILMVAWVQVVLAWLQILQITFLLILPSMAVLFGFAGMVMLFVLLTIFVAELHGFKSMGAVFVSILLVMLAIAMLLNFLFRIFGYDMLGIT
jgi:hypothetical protein